MSTHPNAILMAVLTPDGLTRKTARAVQTEYGKYKDDVSVEDDYMVIGGHDYSIMIMEDDYDDGYQISAPEGSIVLHDFLTYGYGEKAEWTAVQERARSLEAWCQEVCPKHQCSFKIYVSANYW